MTGKERILNTFNHKPVDTVPWVPFAGVHAGKLIAKRRERSTPTLRFSALSGRGASGFTARRAADHV
jgi:hypothetical protein